MPTRLKEGRFRLAVRYNTKFRQFSSGYKEDHPPIILVTYDDWRRRNPWEEDHKILGVDQLNGKECFVIESKHRLDPKYYLSKRLSWIEKENFLPLHEEQFNRDGKLSVMIDKEWDRIKPWDYWSITRWNIIDLNIKTRSIFQPLEQVFDQGFKDEEFTLNQIQKPLTFWRNVNKPLPKYEKPEDFPPEPRVRWEFWEKLGVKPELVK